MRRAIFILTAGISLAACLPAPASAQGRGQGNGNAVAKASGPAFCRSGAGHPVYGRAWCLNQGFALGAEDWRTVDLGRVVIRKTDDRVDRGGLIDILGDIIFGRLDRQRVELHVDVPLSGTWLTPPDGPRVLQVWAGDSPVGELVDNDRNGSVDLIVMRFGG
jgi:hypothetical protein